MMSRTDIKRLAWQTAPDIRFAVPPVCTAFWTSDDWIRWVDWNLPSNAAVLERIAIQVLQDDERIPQ